jgi:vitamin B12 transporter
MKNRNLRAPLAALPLAILATISHAQTPTLPETVVTATRVQQPVTDVLADVSFIDRDALQLSGLQSLGDVLALLPGIQLVTNGSYRSSTTVSLRGASASQAILLVNGVRVGSATLGSFSLESLPLERIERVEVLRGAAAALYGPDAIGGVIQVFTRQPVDGIRRSVTAGLGTDGQNQLGASLQGRSGAWGYSLGASHERANGINVKAPAASGFNKDEDAYQFTSVDGSLQWTLSEQHALNLNLLVSEGEYDFDGAPFPAVAGTNAGNLRAVSEPSLRQLSLDWVAKWMPNWSSTVRVGRSDDLLPSRYWRESNNTLAAESRFNTTRQQLSWQNDLRIGKDTLTLLAEGRQDEVDSSTPYTVRERTTHGLLASYAKRAEVWDAMLTMRRDRNSQFGSFNTWSVSGGYKLNADWRLVGTVGTTFQAPSFNQLYFPGFGNTALQPQEGKSHEIGLRYSAGSTRAGVVVHQNDVKGFINTATNAQSNLAVLKGATFHWDRSWSNTNLSTSYDYADPRLMPSNARVSRVARHMVRAQLTHRVGAWKPFAELRLSGDRFDSVGSVTLPGYGLLNLGTSYELNHNWKVMARLNNVGNKDYSLANGFTTPGRNLFVSLQWSD